MTDINSTHILHQPPTIHPFVHRWFNATVYQLHQSLRPPAELDINDNASVTPSITAPIIHHSTAAPSNNGTLQIPLYTTILLLAITGNTLVILTLVQNRRMRTITNVFLLNLAVSDILLGVLCMPFTLIGQLLRDFVFGGAMCKLLPFLQAALVSVSAWTLVAISCERYFAICHPLSSRRWQTLSHAYKLIAVIWSVSMLMMSPIAVLSRLIPTSHGHHKCREEWPENSRDYERTFNLFLNVVLLVLPLFVLATTYSLITSSLWQGIRSEKVSRRRMSPQTQAPPLLLIDDHHAGKSANSFVEVYINAHGTPSTRCPTSLNGTGGGGVAGGCNNSKSSTATADTIASWNGNQAPALLMAKQNMALPLNTAAGQGKRCGNDHDSMDIRIGTTRSPNPTLRRSNVEKNLQNKRRVIKMLFVVVLEFFICWTPLYIINTITLFDPELVYQTIGYTTISLCQLLAYSSSCCNPITYCFMNRGFRKSFLNLFRCCRRRRHEPLRRHSGGTLNGVASGAQLGVGGGVLAVSQATSENEGNRFQAPLYRKSS